ncbi:MAG: alpha/beta hydrolase [Alphaproteobacteria bacterium]
MPHVTTDDGVRLYCEESGQGLPIVFVHEFGGDCRSWAPQVRYFSRHHRCITYNARGYPPSDVPDSVERYSQDRAVGDLLAVMDAHALDRAHIVGLSMGGFATLHFGLRHPDRARSLLVAGCGYGAEKHRQAEFRRTAEDVAANFEARGSTSVAAVYAEGAARVQYQNKDPQGWREFRDQLAGHSAKGSANTMRGVQARRPSLYDFEDALKAMAVPTLIVSGDEDDHCLAPALFLKKTIPASGLLVLPKTGHIINLEEPTAFNQAAAEFFATVEAGRWLPRDPRARTEEILRAR